MKQISEVFTEHLFEEKVSSETVYTGKIFTVTKERARLENGTIADRDVVYHHGGVCIVPLTDQNEVILVKQFRYPYKQVLLEVPAGKLEKGEIPLECGKRELQEETGAIAESFLFLGEIYPTPAYNTEIIYIYLARELEYIENNLDADEFLDVEKIHINEVEQMIMDNKIKDAKTQIAILKTVNFLKNLEKE
jgi:ADP-ribose pyrophosphatase